MSDSQPLTKADLKEFADDIKNEFIDVRADISGVKSSINTLENKVDDMDKRMETGFKSVREDIDAIGKTQVKHDKEIKQLKLKTA